MTVPAGRPGSSATLTAVTVNHASPTKPPEATTRSATISEAMTAKATTPSHDAESTTAKATTPEATTEVHDGDGTATVTVLPGADRPAGRPCPPPAALPRRRAASRSRIPVRSRKANRLVTATAPDGVTASRTGA